MDTYKVSVVVEYDEDGNIHAVRILSEDMDASFTVNTHEQKIRANAISLQMGDESEKMTEAQYAEIALRGHIGILQTALAGLELAHSRVVDKKAQYIPLGTNDSIAKQLQQYVMNNDDTQEVN